MFAGGPVEVKECKSFQVKEAEKDVDCQDCKVFILFGRVDRINAVLVVVFLFIVGDVVGSHIAY